MSQAKTFGGYVVPQVGLPLAGEALGSPSVAQAILAATNTASGYQDTVGAATQGIFDKGWRQHAGADKAHRGGIGVLERSDVGPLVTPENDDSSRTFEVLDFFLEIPA